MLDLNVPFATLVLDHSEVAPVFQRHRLDFCCRGDLPLSADCREMGLDPEAGGASAGYAVHAAGLVP